MSRDEDWDGDEGESVAADDWRKRWPHHCVACGGWGFGPTIYERHGFTHGPAEAIAGDACEALDEGTCHRCGHSGPGDEGEPAADPGTHPCPACGWDGDDGVPA